MAAAQVTGDPLCPCGCGAWAGWCNQPDLSTRYRLPQIAFPYRYGEEVFPTKPPGVLTMSDEIDRSAPTAPAPGEFSESEPVTKTDNPNPLPNATQGDSYFASAARDFSAALVEMRKTGRAIDDGFRTQSVELRALGGELATIRHEMQGFGVRISTLESGQRDVRAELAEVKTTLRDALARIESLEAELPPKAKTVEPAPPAAAPSA